MSTILVADDNLAVLTLVGEALREAGHRVLSTTDPEKVTGLLDESPVDAAILDVVMPSLNGLELLKKIRARPRWQALPVLLLSGLGDTEDRVRGLREGADDYLSKPFEPDELVARVERLISRRGGEVGLAGNLENFTPGDVTQNLTQGSKTGCLRISGDSQRVEVNFLRGSVVSARMGGLHGEDALLALLGLKSGHFVFEPTSEAEQGQNSGTKLLELNSILLEAAWLEDELLRRRADIPAADQALFVDGPPPTELPDDFADLPFSAVHRNVRQSPGMDLNTLLSLEIAAPARMLLALAVMKELGVVAATKALKRPVPESVTVKQHQIQDPVGHVLEACHVRGSATNISLLILFQSTAWDSVLEMLATIPAASLMGERQQVMEDLRERGNGTVRMNHHSGSIVLNLKPFRDDKVHGAALLHLAAGVVIWLHDGALPQVLPSYVDRLTKESSIGLLVAPQSRTADQITGDTTNWRVTTESPNSFSELAALLSI